MSTKSAKKVECLNPNTGRRMSIDSDTYDLFSKAIYHTLKKEKHGMTYTGMVKGIKKCFHEQKTVFNGSIEWYAVTVKHNMTANGVIETFVEKGRKLHRLKK
ncbi:MAG TPA: hypothetical protein VFP87_10425 [Chitinophagaceae bacterium]|nr:hypothetical protein [Chitinophagaceae bacterium]